MYKLTNAQLIDIISVCEVRTFWKKSCRRCQYEGEPCNQAKARLREEVLEKMAVEDVKPVEYNDFLKED